MVKASAGGGSEVQAVTQKGVDHRFGRFGK
jgi:hypothetical protein